ncbi:hypothetical protein Daus18300_004102 [Diaporthe australafricana]|uniref:Rrn9 domain-containing protein n=1 Tax=Diaporthe australafricana TaxID=127596 RepID=A0ABR3XBA3_9PEZI
MASSQDDDDEWDKSTSEIQSEDSDDLHESRPNRWKGPPQTWRTIVEDDRLTHNALERVRNQDLSLHLYNAFALRQGAPPAAADDDSSLEEDVDAETGRPVRNEPWAPPKSWTAWPVGTEHLQVDDFMKKTEDEDEVFTSRRLERQMPSSTLEEVVSATTLRFAKERFLRRRVTEPSRGGDNVSIKIEHVSSGNESLPSEVEDDDDERTDVSREPEVRKQKTPVRMFKPAVATDDDVSYDLIRPSTRNILGKLDRTLTVLHNARMTSAQNLEDSEESSSENEDASGDLEQPPQPSQPQQSSRASSSPDRSRSRSRISSDEEAAMAVKKKSNRGRPRKYVQLEGESERDFLVRRARALKEKQPLAGDDNDATTSAGESQSSPRKPRWGRKRRRESMTEDREYWMHKKLERFNLRDWSDVMGAAALAGFPPSVVARATQRCADLFGQGMEMHRINETSASSGATGVHTTTYQPGAEMAPSRSESDEDVDDLHLRRARSMSRNSSAAPSRPVSSTSDEEGHETGGSPKKPQKQTRPRGKGQHYCPYTDCSRAVDGFDRPFNLKRHMKLVHGQDNMDVVEKEEADTDDMDGGIHRDGFLEPIRVQKGWRAEDTKKRAERKPATKRQQDEKPGNGEDTEPAQDSSRESDDDSE